MESSYSGLTGTRIRIKDSEYGQGFKSGTGKWLRMNADKSFGASGNPSHDESWFIFETEY